MQITVLGGAGIIGQEVARLLAAEPAVTRLIVADLDEAGAHALVATLPPGRAEARSVDVGEMAALVALLRGSAVVVNAVQYYFNLAVMRACLAAGCHYLDLGGLFHTTRQQLALDDVFRAAGLTALLGIGSCPGVANVQAALAAAPLEGVESIHIFNGATQDKGDALQWAYSLQTILDEISLPAMQFRAGHFEEVPALSGEAWYEFDEPIGYAKVHHSLHSEVATLPLSFRHKGIQGCSFKISFFGYSEAALRKLQFLAELGLTRTDPIEVRGQQVRPRDLLVRLLQQAPQRQRAPTEKAQGFKQIVTVVRGSRDGLPVVRTVSSTAWPRGPLSGGTLLVAAPPAIAALWLGEGRITQRGAVPPEIALPPLPFFEALARFGPHTTLEERHQVA